MESNFSIGIPRLFAKKVSVNKIFTIETEPLSLSTENGIFDVPIPMSALGLKPIQFHLISKTSRTGMVRTFWIFNDSSI